MIGNVYSFWSRGHTYLVLHCVENGSEKTLQLKNVWRLLEDSAATRLSTLAKAKMGVWERFGKQRQLCDRPYMCLPRGHVRRECAGDEQACPAAATVPSEMQIKTWEMGWRWQGWTACVFVHDPLPRDSLEARTWELLDQKALIWNTVCSQIMSKYNFRLLKCLFHLHSPKTTYCSP